MLFFFFWHLAYNISVVIKSSVETLAGILQNRIINILMNKYVSMIV